MRSVVRWNNEYSHYFSITRGTKQGSILSPTLFNIFINDLLLELNNVPQGARLGHNLINSFAYADDITVLSPTTHGLQTLINTCHEYARKWRFNFGIKKTKCMSINGNNFKIAPTWLLGTQKIENVSELEILGTVFTNDLNYTKHAELRIQACRKAMYGLNEMGCCYPGLSSDVKIYLWKSIGLPTLLYGLEAINLRKLVSTKLESCQASFVKRILGFRQRTHHSKLLAAARIQKVDDILKRNMKSLFKRIFNVDSPTRDICAFQLANFILKGTLIKGTLIEKLVTGGVSPTHLLFERNPVSREIPNSDDGIVDSLRYLIMHSNFLKPYSDEHIIASLLVKAF